jgi:hypothetical protein
VRHAIFKKITVGILLTSLLVGSVYCVGHAALATDSAAEQRVSSSGYFYDNVFASTHPTVVAQHADASTTTGLFGLLLATVVGLVAGIVFPKPASSRLTENSSHTRIAVRPRRVALAMRRNLAHNLSAHVSAPIKECQVRFHQYLFSARKEGQAH